MQHSTAPYTQLTPAPWKHPSELAMVRDWFYPHHISLGLSSVFAATSSRGDHNDRRRDAINLVSLWQFKEPKLTQALISTAHLTDAVLHDRPEVRGGTGLSGLALRGVYAMSFCRFVNALVDRDVRKSATATIAKVSSDRHANAESDQETRSRRGNTTMYTHAMSLGLPDSFVELRHQAIHDEMPSLEVLRLRTVEALEWLWERWWKVNVTGSVEPALSEWEQKQGSRRKRINRPGLDSNGTLCRSCRKRTRSLAEEDEPEADGWGESSVGTEFGSGDPSSCRKKQRKVPRSADDGDDGDDDDNLALQEPRLQPWTVYFPRGLVQLQECKGQQIKAELE